MGNIVLLDEQTINKIAAGEVIERPASVIKEMVENSIDAKANKITIEIKNGGISYIKITDNGKGIATDDLEIAFERHATSKIRCAEDLNTVTSMGFRGEALASIAAIANVELVSKTAEQDIGCKIVIEGGKILEKNEVGCQTGTTITVQNLFYNTPVRYKFLKKDYTETGYIEDVVTRIALVNPNIALKLISDGKTIMQTSGNGDIKSVIYSIYGKDIAQGIIEVNYNYEDMKVTGVIGKPEIARSNRSNQLYFVNKRYIKDKILTAATEQGYKGTIEAGKYAFVVLNLEMSQDKVDVNVHPAKLEVRFQDESKVFQAVFHAIKTSMAKYIAKNDTSTQMENIIIQRSNDTSGIKANPIIDNEVKQKSSIFSWRKNKNDKNLANNNIIEALYNEKKENDNTENDEEEIMPKAFTLNKKEDTLPKALSYGIEDIDTVNTSDVLKELKQKNEDAIKEDNFNDTEINKIEDKEKEQIKTEESKLPDGKTYTYVGENKEKIEELLRQLHPETYITKKEQDGEKNVTQNEVRKVEEESVPVFERIDSKPQVAEEDEEYEPNERFVPMIFEKEEEDIQETQEIKIPAQEGKEEITQKFNSIRENLRKLDEKSSKIEERTSQYDEKPSKIEEKIINDEEKISQIDEKPSNFNQMYEKMFGTSIKEQQQEQEEKINAVDIIKDNLSVFDNIPTYQRTAFKLIGVVFNSYIIVEIEKEMYIININTAREKVIYEKLKQSYYNRIDKDSQMLLLPDILELSNKELEVLKENYTMLEKAGFSMEEFGENTIKLTGVPTVCMDLDTKNLLLEIIEAINTVARISIQEKEEKFLSTIAAKIVKKMNFEMSLKEITILMDELLGSLNPFKYDFDKPIAIKMSKYDIERKFSRK